MSDKTRNLLIRYAGALLFASAFAWVFIHSRYSSSLSQADKFKLISDGFAVPGMLMTGYGLLTLIATTGVFDGIQYGLQMAIRALIPGGRLHMQNYPDFLEERKEKRKNPLGYITVVGLVFVAVSLLFVWLYHHAQ